MLYFTSICANYLPKALTLAQSIKAHNKSSKVVLCLLEREAPSAGRDLGVFDEIILAKDAGWHDFEAFIFRHSIVEASTAVKPRFLLHLMARHPMESKFVYLDPDVFVNSDLCELEDILERESIVLAPHLLRPGNLEMELSSLNHGTYNLGFLGIRRNPNSSAFLEWWAERLFYFCYDDKNKGIFTDQKWVDLAPCFFSVHILKHHGYDFATWSLKGAELQEVGGELFVNGDPLRFVHFSGVDSDIIERAISWWLTGHSRDLFIQLHKQYLALLNLNGQEALGKLPWSYSTYRNGSPISSAARLAYRAADVRERYPSPFEKDDAAICGTALTAQPATVPDPAPSLSRVQRLRRSLHDVGVQGSIRKIARKLIR